MENCKSTNNLLCSHNHLGIGYGKLLNIANTRIGLRAILRVAMNVYENADYMVDELYRLYPEMDSYNTQERTEAASQVLTDLAFASQAYNEAQHHATYFCLFQLAAVCCYQYVHSIIILITHHMPDPRS